MITSENEAKAMSEISVSRSLNISIGTVMKNLEMLKLVPDHLNTKKICEHAVKKLPYLLRHVSN